MLLSKLNKNQRKKVKKHILEKEERIRKCRIPHFVEEHNIFFMWSPLVRRHLSDHLLWFIFQSSLHTYYTLQIMLNLSVWAAIHVLHSGHFLSWDMGSPHDAILTGVDAVHESCPQKVFISYYTFGPA